MSAEKGGTSRGIRGTTVRQNACTRVLAALGRRVGAHHKGVPAFSHGTLPHHGRSTPSRDARCRAR
eukprot:6275261-Prymnesium_polylepis.1